MCGILNHADADDPVIFVGRFCYKNITHENVVVFNGIALDDK